MHRLTRHRLFILAAICAFWTALILFGRQFAETPFLSAPWRGEQAFQDLLRREGKKTPTRADFDYTKLYHASRISLIPGATNVPPIKLFATDGAPCPINSRTRCITL